MWRSFVVSLMAAGGGSPAAEATTTVARVRHTYHPRAGLTLTSLRYTDPDVQVRVLEFSPGPGSDGYTVDVGVGGPEITSRATPSSIGAAVDAAAAINGDFSLAAQPAHFNAVDSDIRTDGLMKGSGFAISKDERFAWAGHPTPEIVAVASTGPSFSIDQWNGDDRSTASGPVGAEITAYTKAGGWEKPSEDSCAVRTTVWSWAMKQGTWS